MRLIGGLYLEQFRVREDDSELIVQLVEQLAQFGIGFQRVSSGIL